MLREKAKPRKETQRESESEQEIRRRCQGLAPICLEARLFLGFSENTFLFVDYPGFMSLVNPQGPCALNTSFQLVHVATGQ